MSRIRRQDRAIITLFVFGVSLFCTAAWSDAYPTVDAKQRMVSAVEKKHQTHGQPIQQGKWGKWGQWKTVDPNSRVMELEKKVRELERRIKDIETGLDLFNKPKEEQLPEPPK